MVKYRAALWSYFKLTALVFYHVWNSPLGCEQNNKQSYHTQLISVKSGNCACESHNFLDLLVGEIISWHLVALVSLGSQSNEETNLQYPNMFRRAYPRTALLALGWIPADFRSTVVVAHRTTYMWTSLSLLDIKPRRGSSCCLMGSPDININSGFKTASRGAAQCGGAAPCLPSLLSL